MIQFPWPSNDAPDYQVKIEVLQFEGNSNQQAWLTARWSVIDRNKKILVSQRSQLNRRAGSLSTEDFAKALSETLGDLSREIVKTLQLSRSQGNLNASCPMAVRVAPSRCPNLSCPKLSPPRCERSMIRLSGKRPSIGNLYLY